MYHHSLRPPEELDSEWVDPQVDDGEPELEPFSWKPVILLMLIIGSVALTVALLLR